MFGGPVIISKELGSEWVSYSVEDKPLGKTNIINQSVRSNEEPKQSNYRGIGLAEMIDSIENKREHRCNGELALHVLDIIESAMISSETKKEVNLRSTCKRPNSFDDQEIRKLLKTS
jgi:predicted dehydrogenase